jgi:hypothetical protein
VICRKCKKDKEHNLDNFYKRSTGKLDTICKVCVKNRTQEWARKKGVPPRKKVSEEHKLKVAKECRKRYYLKKGKENQRRWRYENPEKVKEYSKKFRENNKHKIALNSRNRKNRTTNSKLAKQFNLELKEVYDKCQYMCEKFKGNFQVDHIIPLNNKNVCGLHVPWNLQIIFKSLNCKKSNKFDGTSDNEGWCLDG